MEEYLEKIKEWAQENPGKIAGLILGLLFFIIYALMGPFILMFVLLVGGGYVIGKSMDEDRSVQDLITEWFDKAKELEFLQKKNSDKDESDPFD